ncbi:MAG: Uma2 family endonuclease [Actinomycetota bacterium]|nr:Uma2 family endonuclease [Actinomycetota bacterium]
MALPVPPVRPLTVAEYAALPEDGEIHYELQEGILVMSPSSITDHQRCLRRLLRELEDQVPGGLEPIPDVDVDLQLVRPAQPGFVRRPDLVVVTCAAIERVRWEQGLLRASDVVLAVEIISPGSRRMDTVVKHGEYADAGIPHYWVVDFAGDVTLTAHHLAGEFGYADTAPIVGIFTTADPFPVRLDLGGLV